MRPKAVLTGRYRYSRWRWRVLVCAFDLVGGLLVWLWRWVKPRPRVDQPRRILIVQLDHLGDSVLTTPMIAALRTAYPEAAIDVLASTSNRSVFEADPEVSRVYVAQTNWFDRGRGVFASVPQVWKLGRRLRLAKHDLGIDVRGDVLSVLVLVLAGIPRRLGWAMGGGGFLLTDVADWRAGRHEVESRMALLARLGIVETERPRVRVHVGDSDRAAVARWLLNEWPRARATTSAGKSPFPLEQSVDPETLHAGRFGEESPLLAVHLGAGNPAKRWPLAHWRKLVLRFLDDGWRVVVVGGPHEEGVRLGISPHPNLRDWTSQLTVPQTTALLERADLFIGADSGPAHLAACAAVPSIVLFSGTNRASQWRPWSRSALVLRHRVVCGPCHRKFCPLVDHPCLGRIAPDRVYRAARRWWARHNALPVSPASPSRRAMTSYAVERTN